MGECRHVGAVFCNCLGLQKRVSPKCMDHGIDPTHPHGQVENATASSAGGSPDPDGKVRLGPRLPFSDGLDLGFHIQVSFFSEQGGFTSHSRIG
jgi:hypothetical protein